MGSDPVSPPSVPPSPGSSSGLGASAITLVIGDARLDVDAVVFDFDGVLADSVGSSDRTWRVWAERLGLDPDAVAAEAHGRSAWASTLAWIPEADVPAAFALIGELELGDADTVRSIPGAVRLTAELPPGRWGIVTSATRALFEARSAVAGIAHPSLVLTADDVRTSKPNPEGYATAIRSLGVDPARVVVFEDTASGIAAARAAGVGRVVRVGPGEPAHGEDLVVPHLEPVHRLR